MAEVETQTTTETATEVEVVDTPQSTDSPDTTSTPEETTDASIPKSWPRNEALGFDSDTIGWLENKNYDNPQAAITSQRELEKKLGGPPEMLQKWPESDDKEGFEPIFRRLGKPETVEGYKFEFEEGVAVDPDTLEWFKGTAHEHDMTNAQAQGVILGWNTEVARLQAERQQELEVKNHTEKVELENQWGTKCAERLDYGHRALLALGLKEENIDTLQDSLGPKMLAEMAAKIADTMGEDSIAEHTDTPAFGTTKEQVQNSIDELIGELSADKERYNKYYSDHSAPKESTGKDFRKMKQLESQMENLIRAGA